MRQCYKQEVPFLSRTYSRNIKCEHKKYNKVQLATVYLLETFSRSALGFESDMPYFILEVDSTNCKLFYSHISKPFSALYYALVFQPQLIYNFSENFIVLEEIFFHSEMHTPQFFFSRQQLR